MKTIQQTYPESSKGEETILQFGEGNFIRAFADWMIHQIRKQGLYDGRVVICQPIASGLCETLNEQCGKYTVMIRDTKNGRSYEKSEVIDCVSRCIDPYQNHQALLEVARSPYLQAVISNTTERGILYEPNVHPEDNPPASFPGKLAVVLYERFKTYEGAMDKGLLILPLELIDKNGQKLRELILRYAEEWSLEPEFAVWVNQACHFANTLVDRIVTGYPRTEAKAFEKQLGYSDKLLDVCEEYNLLAIEGPQEWSRTLPLHLATGATVVWAPNIEEYRSRKLYLLNGAHNAVGLAAYLAGHRHVIEWMNDQDFRAFTKQVMQNEIVPNFEQPKLAKEFALQVFHRFENPSIQHRIEQIAIHGCDKFRLRCLPSILKFQTRTGSVPPRLSFSFAAFIAFYNCHLKDGAYRGECEDGQEYILQDAPEILEFFENAWKTGDVPSVVKKVLGKRDFWNGEDLTEVPGLCQAVSSALMQIQQQGVRIAMRHSMEAPQ